MAEINKKPAIIGIIIILIALFFLFDSRAMSVVQNIFPIDVLGPNWSDLTNESTNDLSNVIQIQGKIGQCSQINDELQITKIAILFKLISADEMDTSELIIQLKDSTIVQHLQFSGKTALLESFNLFDHPIWDDIDDNTFGFVALFDDDRSLVDHTIMNDDSVYILINLGDHLYMKKDDSLTVMLYPPSGLSKTITLKAPTILKSTVTFE